jgi:hypothetical protein
MVFPFVLCEFAGLRSSLVFYEKKTKFFRQYFQRGNKEKSNQTEKPQIEQKKPLFFSEKRAHREIARWLPEELF